MATSHQKYAVLQNFCTDFVARLCVKQIRQIDFQKKLPRNQSWYESFVQQPPEVTQYPGRELIRSNRSNRTAGTRCAKIGKCEIMSCCSASKARPAKIGQRTYIIRKRNRAELEPRMAITVEWCSRRSRMAVATAGSPNTLPHSRPSGWR